MDAVDYRRFLGELGDWARRDPRIIGLVALGSAAGRSHEPDEWSDHDIWVVTGDGEAGGLREDPAWLPDADRIVGWFVETLHGRSAVYDDGHLVEVAIFEDSELETARANDFRVLYDGDGIERRVRRIVERTSSEAERDADSDRTIGRFVVEMLIGLGRLGRGEFLSANELIRGRAVTTLLRAVAGSPPRAEQLDSLDPHRRFETIYPDLAGRLDEGLELPLIDVAQLLLDTAKSVLPALDQSTAKILQERIALVRAARFP